MERNRDKHDYDEGHILHSFSLPSVSQALIEWLLSTKNTENNLYIFPLWRRNNFIYIQICGQIDLFSSL